MILYSLYAQLEAKGTVKELMDNQEIENESDI